MKVFVFCLMILGSFKLEAQQKLTIIYQGVFRDTSYNLFDKEYNYEIKENERLFNVVFSINDSLGICQEYRDVSVEKLIERVGKKTFSIKPYGHVSYYNFNSHILYEHRGLVNGSYLKQTYTDTLKNDWIYSDKKKYILSYECEQAYRTDSNGVITEMVWFTKKLPFSFMFNSLVPLKGCVLEYFNFNNKVHEFAIEQIDNASKINSPNKKYLKTKEELDALKVY